MDKLQCIGEIARAVAFTVGEVDVQPGCIALQPGLFWLPFGVPHNQSDTLWYCWCSRDLAR